MPTMTELMNIDVNRSYRPSEVVAITGLSQSYIYQLIGNPDCGLTAIKVGAAVRIPGASLSAFVDTHEIDKLGLKE